MRKNPIECEWLVGVAIVGVVALMLLVAIVKCCGGVNWEYSSGSRSGVIQKLSKKGVIWKTWEGEVNLGYNTSSKGSDGHLTISPAIFEFSVSDDSVAKMLKDAEASGKRVTVEYKQYFLRGWDKGGTSYDVTGIASQTAEVVQQ